MPLTIPNYITIGIEDTAAMVVFTEIADWGFKTELYRERFGVLSNGELFMDSFVSPSTYMRFNVRDGIVIVCLGISILRFPMASPTLFADLKLLIVKSQD